jgi:hypothetical protein
MARLLLENDWFEPLAPNAIVDTVYEDLLLGRADILFPGFLAARHHYLLSNERGHATPHFALIDRYYRSWWLVLLHTGKSPLASYFQSIAEVLRAHPHGQDDARILVQRNATLVEAELIKLMRAEMPKLYVVLCQPPAPSITSSDIRIGIAELFRASDGREILRINGEQPRQPDARIGTCTRDSIIQRSILKLTVREGSDLAPESSCEIEMDGALTTWTVRRQSTEIWLVPSGIVILPLGVDLFDLVRYDDGRLELIPHTS